MRGRGGEGEMKREAGTRGRGDGVGRGGRGDGERREALLSLLRGIEEGDRKVAREAREVKGRRENRNGKALCDCGDQEVHGGAGNAGAPASIEVFRCAHVVAGQNDLIRKGRQGVAQTLELSSIRDSGKHFLSNHSEQDDSIIPDKLFPGLHQPCFFRIATGGPPSQRERPDRCIDEDSHLARRDALGS